MSLFLTVILRYSKKKGLSNTLMRSYSTSGIEKSDEASKLDNVKNIKDYINKIVTKEIERKDYIDFLDSKDGRWISTVDDVKQAPSEQWELLLKKLYENKLIGLVGIFANLREQDEAERKRKEEEKRQHDKAERKRKEEEKKQQQQAERKSKQKEKKQKKTN